MHHLTVAARSLLVGDEMADALVRYGAHLGSIHGADGLAIRAIDADGGAEEGLVLLLNSGVSLVTGRSDSTLPEPDNRAAIAYIARRLAVFEVRPD